MLFPCLMLFPESSTPLAHSSRMRRLGGSCCASVLLVRCVSDTRLSSTREDPHWAAPGQAPERPNTRSLHPHLRLRKSTVEWRLHHGNGVRHGNLGPTREIADFEYSDGTPAPVSIRRFSLKHHQDQFLVQLIRAGAKVEKAAASGYLPRIPGVPEQRNWDPEIPLFLEDADEHGSVPTDHYQRHQAIKDTFLDKKFAGAAASRDSAPARGAPDTMEPITAFASYDPASFISEPLPFKERKKPIWSRRRWALSDEFLVPKSPQPKNTIKDE